MPRRSSPLPRLLVALPDGTVTEHPTLLAPVRSGDDEGVPGPSDAAIALPEGASLSSLPGQRPVGIDPETGERVVLHELKVGRKLVKPDAIACVLPPGYTRTFLPVAHRILNAPFLSQWAYAAAGWSDGTGLVVHALHTDKRTHWGYRNHQTADLPERVAALKDVNRLTTQLAKCALEYRCFTAQNVFYRQDEGAIPSSTGCNSRCIGCISETPEDSGAPASHERMDGPPTAEEMAELGISHLLNATESMPGRAMVSFGQGCEGEPLTRAGYIEKAIRKMRAVTSRGSINVNTNGSRPDALSRLIDAGLDACRISINSARKPLYEAYYRPVDGYTWEDVRESFKRARDGGLYIAINLLTFPGVTDRAGEVAALEDLVAEFGVGQVQTRNLALDPESYLRVARPTMAEGPAIGIDQLIKRLKKARPGLVVGNYARGLGERGTWEKRS